MMAFSPDGRTSTKYEDLASDVDELAGRLVSAGLSHGEHVAVCAGVNAESLSVILAILRAGGVVVPIDTQMGDEGLRHVLSDSEPRFLFTTTDKAERISRLKGESSPDILLLDESDNGRSWRDFGHDGGAKEFPLVQRGDHAVLFYTSGTTGAPKGVPLTHANLVHQIDVLTEAGIASDSDRLLLALPLHHVYPFVMGLLVPLAFGACIVVPSALTGPQIIRAVREGGVCIIIGVPRLYRALHEGIQSQIDSRAWLTRSFLRASESLCLAVRRKTGRSMGRIIMQPLRRKTGQQLRLMASGGSLLDPELAEWLEALGWEVVVGYGLTETSPLLTLRLPRRDPIKSVGRPVPGIEVRVAAGAQPDNDDTRQTGSAGLAGEIQARGAGVFSGYRNLPEETGKSFTEDGWFRTGDLGYLDEDGCLHVNGRVSTMIVTEGGENVQPEDVERAYAAHSFIGEIGVLEQNRKLVALVVPDKAGATGMSPDEMDHAAIEALREMSGKLPSYMRVSEVRVTTRGLPRTRLGKIRRHILERRWEEAGEQTRKQEPAGPMEFEEMTDSDKLLLENPAASRAWEWLAERYPDKRLTPDTNPQLDLGVDSMGWLNLTLDLNETAGVELNEAAISRIDTVRDLLKEIADASGKGEEQLDPVDEPDSVLSEEQRRWLPPRTSIENLSFCAAYAIGSSLLRIFYRMEIEGLENIPRDRACVLAPNHVSYLDPFVLGVALGRKRLKSTCWAGLTDAAFDTAIKRRGSRLALTVPIEPRRGVMSSLAYASSVLRKNYRLVWFPEGGRSRDGKLQSFRPGLGVILERIPVPVVPVFIRGTYEAWAPHEKRPKPGRVKISFGQPADVGTLRKEGTGEDDAQCIVSGLRERVVQLADSKSRQEKVEGNNGKA